MKGKLCVRIGPLCKGLISTEVLRLIVIHEYGFKGFVYIVFKWFQGYRPTQDCGKICVHMAIRIIRSTNILWNVMCLKCLNKHDRILLKGMTF